MSHIWQTRCSRGCPTKSLVSKLFESQDLTSFLSKVVRLLVHVFFYGENKSKLSWMSSIVLKVFNFWIGHGLCRLGPCFFFRALLGGQWQQQRSPFDHAKVGPMPFLALLNFWHNLHMFLDILEFKVENKITKFRKKLFW